MKLYFAGAEAWLHLLLDMGVKNQLLSYYYFRQALNSRRAEESARARGMLERMRLAKAKGYSFMLDSGAFTYLIKQDSGRLPRPERYFEEYLDFITEYHDLFDIIVEFDVENVKGVNQKDVDAWTNRMLDTEGLGQKTMPVFHNARGAKWLKDWLLDVGSPYVGLGSDGAGDAGKSASIIAQAHRCGKFIHGFGQTRIKTDLKYTPFDSIDSTTWLRADKYGGTCIFLNNKFIVLDHLHKGERGRFKAYWDAWGLDFKKVMADDLETMRYATIIAWRELANFLEGKQGKLPYLYQAYLEGIPVAEHPLITAKRREKKLAKAF
jgi:hypothetical protein